VRLLIGAVGSLKYNNIATQLIDTVPTIWLREPALTCGAIKQAAQERIDL